LYNDLHRAFPSVAVTHGDLDQKKREKIMADFRAEKIHVLIATNVMSRGIDVKGISHIINYDLPQDIESYVHRIGRTGRMGKDGKALSFVTPDQGGMLTDIENMINKLIDVDHMEGFEAFEHKQPKASSAPGVEGEAKKPVVPVFGRRNKKYSNRV
jgi:ATP-dependent RNA helicase DeaD